MHNKLTILWVNDTYITPLLQQRQICGVTYLCLKCVYNSAYKIVSQIMYLFFLYTFTFIPTNAHYIIHITVLASATWF
jgi:hypothetical protein